MGKATSTDPVTHCSQGMLIVQVHPTNMVQGIRLHRGVETVEHPRNPKSLTYSQIPKNPQNPKISKNLPKISGI